VSPNAVYGVALNFRSELDALADQFTRDPYKKPPVAPVLYLRPRNTWNVTGAPIHLPAGIDRLKLAGTLGVVIGRRLSYVPICDASIPHESYYRPALRQRCRDGFCIIGPHATDRAPEVIRTYLNDELRCRGTLTDLVRPIDKLLAGLSEFMTLEDGDIVLIGEPPDSPLASAGDIVRVEIDGLAPIENRVMVR
jgi:5-oxopent-3-ene-1,2,5-tricarboxylate decarboxylase / 2-hydroxyhepta-2,4-diene-1,7-dioate isomerase